MKFVFVFSVHEFYSSLWNANIGHPEHFALFSHSPEDTKRELDGESWYNFENTTTVPVSKFLTLNSGLSLVLEAPHVFVQLYILVLSALYLWLIGRVGRSGGRAPFRPKFWNFQNSNLPVPRNWARETSSLVEKENKCGILSCKITPLSQVSFQSRMVSLEPGIHVVIPL